MTSELWGAIEVSDWAAVPVIRNRLATEADVRAGRAVFCLQDASPPEAEPLAIPLPALAVIHDGESQLDEVVVAIQAERDVEKRLVGYRFVSGGNGICTLEELRWISDQEARVRLTSA